MLLSRSVFNHCHFIHMSILKVSKLASFAHRMTPCSTLVQLSNVSQGAVERKVIHSVAGPLGSVCISN